MGLVDHESSFTIDFPRREAFQIALKALKNDISFKVLETNEILNSIKLTAGVSMWSWGENITVTFHDRGPQCTEVRILSTPKTGILFGGALDMGKNRANIEKISNCISMALSRRQKQQKTFAGQSQNMQGDFNFSCPFCHALLECPAEMEDQDCQCPQCGHPIRPVRNNRY